MEHLREHSHLRARTNIVGAVSRVRSSIAQAIHRYFFEQSFVWINTPILTACDCEGAGELFTATSLDMQNLPKDHQGAVDFSEDLFGKQTFLTVSGQLNAEAYCLALSKVYTFGPTFRAENSNTTRHLAEFLDVGTGNRLCQFARRCGFGGRPVEVCGAICTGSSCR